MYSTVVVGTDGSATADNAVDAAFELDRLRGARLHVVTAYKPLSDQEVFERQRGLPPSRRGEIDEASDARALLDRMAKTAADRGLPVELHARVGDPSATILDVARDVGADVIVVGNRGMSGVRRVLGSVPNDVTHHAPCSVLVVRTEG
jgi:nucleotide-binding universal stress UspA family protein